MAAGESRLSLLFAAALLAVAFAHAESLTGSMSWPAGPDMMRDVAAAHAVKQSFTRSLRRGVPLIDPYYRGETFWYNPGVPAIVAGLSWLTGAPVQVVDVRAGAYLNLLTPISFYVLCRTLFGPLVGVAALAAFVFIEPFSSWQAGTYSPWLVVSNFAQAFFYVGLLAWLRFRAKPGLASACLMGAAMGGAFLVHTAPAVLLAGMFTVAVIAMWRRSAPHRWQVLKIWTAGILVAALVAVPTLSTIVHYHGRVVQPLPFIWLDPSMELGNLREFAVVNATQYLFNALTLIGVVVLIRRSRPLAGVLFAWAGLALILFVWSGYAWRVTGAPLLLRLTPVPAHHFLVYFRAAQSAFCGIAIVAMSDRIATLSPKPRRAAAVAIAMAVAVMLAIPGYLSREDFTSYPAMARSAFSDPLQLATIEWIERETRTGDVFLAPENASFSMVGAVGRKAVLVERFFSNPYVEWYSRQRDAEAMWTAIGSSQCAAFEALAIRYRVGYVLSVAGMTPPVASEACGLRRAFAAGPFTIHSRVWQARVALE